MTRGPLNPHRPPPARATAKPSGSYWHLPFFVSFVLWYAVALAVLLLPGQLPTWPWAEGLLLVLAAVATTASLARFLPLQNALTSTAVISLISAFIITVGARSGLPFGPFRYLGNTGPELFDTLPLLLPLLWVVIVLNCRGVAHLLMRPHRQNAHYGFWIMGLTAALAVIVDLGLEPYAVKVRHYWVWQARHGIPNWYSAPLVSFLGWFVAALAILTFTLPWLINKKQVKQPVDVYPLLVWLLLNLYLLAGNATEQLWPAVVAGGIGAVGVAIPAWRGARHLGKGP